MKRQPRPHQVAAVAPVSWRLEVANSLTTGVRRRRISEDLRCAALADLAVLGTIADQPTNAHAWGETEILSDRFRLTLYDAAYLELAGRRELPLATLDGDLRTAADWVSACWAVEPRTRLGVLEHGRLWWWE